MAGINQGQPEVAVGEPIQFGDIDGFELEQHPVSDRLIIRDTANGTVAYVRAERGGQIGGDGVLIKALKESKPMADTGRTYDTIQEAEREATGWVFVPPGTYNENVEINTEGMTLQGSGYNTLIDGGNDTIRSVSDNVTITGLSVSTTDRFAVNTENSRNNTIKSVVTRQGTIRTGGKNTRILSCVVEGATNAAYVLNGSNSIISCCHCNQSDAQNLYVGGENSIAVNNILLNAGSDSLQTAFGISGNIIVGNIVKNSAINGLEPRSDDSIIANNRVSDSAGLDIENQGTGNIFDGNLTGASN